MRCPQSVSAAAAAAAYLEDLNNLDVYNLYGWGQSVRLPNGFTVTATMQHTVTITVPAVLIAGDYAVDCPDGSQLRITSTPTSFSVKKDDEEPVTITMPSASRT